MAQDAYPHVLLETVAQGAHQGQESAWFGYRQETGYFDSAQPEKLLASVQDPGYANLLDMNLYNIPVLHDMVALDHHSIVDRLAPDAGVLELDKEVLVDPACQIFKGAVSRDDKGFVQIGVFAGVLGVHPDHTGHIVNAFHEGIRVPGVQDGDGK